MRRHQGCLLDALVRSSFAPDQIDAVVRTGGSAQIPRFIQILGRNLEPDRVVISDVFGGVTAGLAIFALM